jgi:alkylation response protein AidB-like acyl-CoA dehydrogenase
VSTTSVSETLEGTPIERVSRLEDVIRQGGDEAQQLRHLPRDVVDALIDAGLFRFTIPRELGGEDASIRETIEVVAAIAAIDASVGWNVMIGSEINAMAAGGMPIDLAKEVYLDNPRVIMCGGGGPGTTPARAVKEDGGYRVWAQSSFISGCHNAEWCFQSAALYDGDDPILSSQGQPVVRTFFIHKSQFEILDTWDVAGIRGSGSHDVKVDGVLVGEKWEPVQLMLPSLYANPVFRVPIPARLAYNKAAVAIGVARGAVDAFVELASTKTPFLTGSLLKDRPVAQYRLGEAEATLRAARALLMEAMDGLVDSLSNGEAEPSLEATTSARLACTFAANASMHVTDVMHNTAGTSAGYMANPLERRLRDAHACASHRWVAHPLYEEMGRILMGERPSMAFF